MRARLVVCLGMLVACDDGDLTVFPSEFTDLYTQDPLRQVDVLLVVDNSGSMVEEQAKLASNFQSFFETFLTAEVDYHIGVTTTDVANVAYAGHLRETQDGLTWIDTDTADPEQAFIELVNVGTEGSGLEAGLEAARLALSEPLRSRENVGFYRPEAALSIIVVSDENDLSAESVDTYLNDYASLKGVEAYRDHSLVNVSAVAGDVPFGCVADDGSGIADAGARYAHAVSETDGVFASICASDFSPIAQALGLNVSGLRISFPLSYCPRPESLVVRVDGEEIPEGGPWTYHPEAKEVRFVQEQAPPPRSTVELFYTFYPENTTTCPAE